MSTNEPEPTPEPAPVDEVIWLDATGLLTGVNTVRRDNGVPELSLGGKDLKEMCERMAREGSPNCYNGRQSAARGNGKQSTIGNLLASVHTPHIGNDPAYTSLSVAACEYKGVKYYLIEAN